MYQRTHSIRYEAKKLFVGEQIKVQNLSKLEIAMANKASIQVYIKYLANNFQYLK